MADPNDNDIPTPPAGGPPPPPPPPPGAPPAPPNVGGPLRPPAPAFSQEQQADIDAVKRERETLEAAVQSGEPGAEERLSDFQKTYDNQYAKADTELKKDGGIKKQYDQLQAEVTGLKEGFAENIRILKLAVDRVESMITHHEGNIATIRSTGNRELEGYISRLNQENEVNLRKFEQLNLEIEAESQYRDEVLALKEAEVRTAKQLFDNANANLKFLNALKEAAKPQIELRFVEAETPKPIDFAQLRNAGSLGENAWEKLRVFVSTQNDFDEVQRLGVSVLSDEDVIKRLNSLMGINRQNKLAVGVLNEMHIMGAAFGAITREPGTYYGGLENLIGLQYDQSWLEVVYHFTNELYRAQPELYEYSVEKGRIPEETGFTKDVLAQYLMNPAYNQPTATARRNTPAGASGANQMSGHTAPHGATTLNSTHLTVPNRASPSATQTTQARRLAQVAQLNARTEAAMQAGHDADRARAGTEGVRFGQRPGYNTASDEAPVDVNATRQRAHAGLDHMEAQMARLDALQREMQDTQNRYAEEEQRRLNAEQRLAEEEQRRAEAEQRRREAEAQAQQAQQHADQLQQMLAQRPTAPAPAPASAPHVLFQQKRAVPGQAANELVNNSGLNFKTPAEYITYLQQKGIQPSASEVSAIKNVMKGSKR